VGEVTEGATAELPVGMRVGVSWMGDVDGECWYCHHGMENLCNKPTFTGYTVNGGYAEYALARRNFTYPLPAGLDDLHVAPLLCAGIIGFRSLRIAGIEYGERVGLFGFGQPSGGTKSTGRKSFDQTPSQRVAGNNVIVTFVGERELFAAFLVAAALSVMFYPFWLVVVR
jgi:Alcohol dehydrogenase GroES-like domain